jgi:hypothetical protein
VVEEAAIGRPRLTGHIPRRSVSKVPFGYAHL